MPDIGKLDRRITLQSPTRAQSATGQVVDQSWDGGVKLWASRAGGTGIQAYEGEQRTSVQQVTFIIRFRQGVNTLQRVLYQGQFYGITSIDEVDGRRKFLALNCSLRDPRPGG